MSDQNMNCLPVPTWNRCGVNHAPAAAVLPEVSGDDWGEANIAFTLPAGVGEAETDFAAFSESGMMHPSFLPIYSCVSISDAQCAIYCIMQA